MTPKELHDELKRLEKKVPLGTLHREHLYHTLFNNLPTLLRALSALSALEGVKGALGKIAANGNNSFVYVLERQDPNVTPSGPPQSHRIGVADFARSALSRLKEAGL